MRLKFLFFVCLLLASSFFACPQDFVNQVPEYGPENGALFIVGGGSTRDILDNFIELAGGPEKAKIIVVPTAGGRETYEDTSVTRSWKRRGVENVKMLHSIDPKEADKEEFVRDLREATGVWFNGGRQWRIVDAYYNTLTYREFHKVLDRGGVIGGSSAGASIQGSFLARGAESDNFTMMAPKPLHRIGFSFLKKSAIDQHIDARNRWNDLKEIILEYPDLIGIGISESTAIVVKKDEFEVIGRSKVAVHDYNQVFAYSDSVHYTILNSGDRYDLKTRSVIYRSPQEVIQNR
ncbi:cyanophycinase [candidate division KSB1 bacterium]